MAGIIGVVHAGVTVTDLEVSIPFYRDVIGLEVRKVEPPKKSRAAILGVPGAEVQCVIMGVPGTNELVELIQYFKPRQMIQYGAPVNSVGQVHIAFKVDDMDAVVARMKEHNVAFVSDNYELIKDGPQAGMKWIYLKDPDGTNIELIQVPEGYYESFDKE